MLLPIGNQCACGFRDPIGHDGPQRGQLLKILACEVAPNHIQARRHFSAQPLEIPSTTYRESPTVASFTLLAGRGRNGLHRDICWQRGSDCTQTRQERLARRCDLRHSDSVHCFLPLSLAAHLLTTAPGGLCAPAFFLNPALHPFRALLSVAGFLPLFWIADAPRFGSIFRFLCDPFTTPVTQEDPARHPESLLNFGRTLLASDTNFGVRSAIDPRRIELDERVVRNMLGLGEDGATAAAEPRTLQTSDPSVQGSKKPDLSGRDDDTTEETYMSENAPFLAKFAKTPSNDEAKSNSNPGTISTRVDRETTDDR